MTSIRLRNFRAALLVGGTLALLTGAGAAAAFQVNNNSGFCLTVTLTCPVGAVPGATVNPSGTGAECVDCNGTCNYSIVGSCPSTKAAPTCAGTIDGQQGLQVDGKTTLTCVPY